MRCHRHAHVLQFANDLRIVAIELAGKLVNSKLWHSLFKPSKVPEAGEEYIYFTLQARSDRLFLYFPRSVPEEEECPY
jgi:hypothetical protein